MKCLILNMFILVICFSSAFAQHITCIDTVTKAGFFYKLKYKNKGGLTSDNSSPYYQPYFIDENAAKGVSLDDIFSLRPHSSDTIKYSSRVPRSSKSPWIAHEYKQLEDICRAQYDQAISLDSLISPTQYFVVRTRPHRIVKRVEIGFSYVRIKWLHLKVFDDVAFYEFDDNHTLDNPRVKGRYYDIFLPLKMYRLNNSVSIDDYRLLIH